MQMLVKVKGPVWATDSGGGGVVVRFQNPGPLTPQLSLLFVTLLYSQLVMDHLTNI